MKSIATTNERARQAIRKMQKHASSGYVFQVSDDGKEKVVAVNDDDGLPIGVLYISEYSESELDEYSPDVLAEEAILWQFPDSEEDARQRGREFRDEDDQEFYSRQSVSNMPIFISFDDAMKIEKQVETRPVRLDEKAIIAFKAEVIVSVRDEDIRTECAPFKLPDYEVLDWYIGSAIDLYGLNYD